MLRDPVARLALAQTLNSAQKKARDNAGLLIRQSAWGLLEFAALFVIDVLADARVILAQHHLAGGVTFVLGGGVEMPGTRSGYQFDFFSHDLSPFSDFHAAGAYVSQYLVDTVLVDDAHTLAGEAQFDPAVLASHPETVTMEVGQEAAARSIVRVRHIITGHRAFSRDLTDLGHAETPDFIGRTKGAMLYII